MKAAPTLQGSGDGDGDGDALYVTLLSTGDMGLIILLVTYGTTSRLALMDQDPIKGREITLLVSS